MFDRKAYMKEYSKRYRQENKERKRELCRNHYYKHHETSKKKKRESYRRVKYGVEPDQYQQMLEQQENRCGICLEDMDRPCIDHCHTTGKVRELLCVACNAGIGNAKEDVVILRSMIDYVQRHKPIQKA